MNTQKTAQWKAIIFAIILASLCWYFGNSPILAQEPASENEACLTCHSNPDLKVEFPDGTSTDAHVSKLTYNNSVHGQEGMTCGGCHPDHQDYPHPELDDAHSRSFTLRLNGTCLECHPDQMDRVQDSIHTQYFDEGRTETAVTSPPALTVTASTASKTLAPPNFASSRLICAEVVTPTRS